MFSIKFVKSKILWFGSHFPKQILDSSKMKEFEDDNFTFDENSRKLSKRVESTAGKGQMCHNDQFLLFPQCFQHTYTADT